MPETLTEDEREDMLVLADIIRCRTAAAFIGTAGRFDLIVVPHPGLTVLELDRHGAYGVRQNKGAPAKEDCLLQGIVVTDAGQRCCRIIIRLVGTVDALIGHSDIYRVRKCIVKGGPV